MVWIVVAIVIVVVAGIVVHRSPSHRFWADTRPGKPGSADPTGNVPQLDHHFRRPPNQGDLL
jgi:hypothetical protein